MIRTPATAARRARPHRVALALALLPLAGCAATSAAAISAGIAQPAKPAPPARPASSVPPAPIQTAPPVAATASPAPPRLIVAIAVDQLSADLFAEYRPLFVGGLSRLTDGVVFPQAYQAHAATETCPGHATILTGVHPGRAGIVANNYFNLAAARADKRVYCVEDEAAPGSASGSGKYVPSLAHLRVPTLGDRMKAARPATQVVSVAGKDRAALLLGGRGADAIYWLAPGSGIATLRDRTPSPAATAIAPRIVADIDEAQPAAAMPVPCLRRALPITVTGADGKRQTVGAGQFARDAGAMRAFAASPAADAAVLALATALRDERRLGEGPGTDLLAIGLSATDYVGHAFGTGGAEMCGQLLALDQLLLNFFAGLDRTGIDYAVMLTADHGGHDLPERNRTLALPDAQRADAALDGAALSRAIAAELGLDPAVTGPLLYSDGPFGDFYLSRTLTPSVRARVDAAFRRRVAGHPQVEALVSRAELAAMPPTTRPADEWSIRDRLRAGFDPERSGDYILLLKPRVTPIPEAGVGYVATHGSAWDYDRRVPLLFWRRGLAGFEQPAPVMTVDAAPTLAAMIGLPVAPGDMDGRCLDTVAGPADGC